MSNTNNVGGVGNTELYLKNALETNLFFLKVRVTIGIILHTLMFLALTYLIHKLIFEFGELEPTSFIKEFIFLLLTPILFRVLLVGSYSRSRESYYNNIIKNKK